jgi:hypothetical protein
VPGSIFLNCQPADYISHSSYFREGPLRSRERNKAEH